MQHFCQHCARRDKFRRTWHRAVKLSALGSCELSQDAESALVQVVHLPVSANVQGPQPSVLARKFHELVQVGGHALVRRERRACRLHERLEERRQIRVPERLLELHRRLAGHEVNEHVPLVPARCIRSAAPLPERVRHVHVGDIASINSPQRIEDIGLSEPRERDAVPHERHAAVVHVLHELLEDGLDERLRVALALAGLLVVAHRIGDPVARVGVGSGLPRSSAVRIEERAANRRAPGGVAAVLRKALLGRRELEEGPAVRSLHLLESLRIDLRERGRKATENLHLDFGLMPWVLRIFFNHLHRLREGLLHEAEERVQGNRLCRPIRKPSRVGALPHATARRGVRHVLG